MPEVSVPSATDVIIAKPSWDYRWRRILLVVVIFGYGLWSLYDGYVHMPQVNAQALRDHPGIEQLPYPGLDIPFNQKLGMILPPVSMVFLGWVLYASRGSYRYDGNTVSVPGHGNVPVKSIRKIDNTKWDRKGIAYLHYQVAGSAKMRVLRLDDFIYDRPPTDAIYEKLSAAVEAAKTQVAVNAPIPGSAVSGGGRS
jgi:hypothetical protein